MKDHNAVHDGSFIEKDHNADPITGSSGAHPVGTGVGAAGGGAAGAAIGSVGGPIGAGIGLVVGAVAGGLGGKGVAEMIDPTVEDAYWRGEYSNSPYVGDDESYQNYQPAYQTGYEGYARYPGKRFEEVESDLQRDYEKNCGGNSTLSWDKAKCAVHDAWDRVEETFSSDRNGTNR